MSNYINSLNNYYKNSYSFTKLNSSYSKFNTAPLLYGSSASNSNYVDSKGINYLSQIQEGAKSLASSLKDMTSMSTFKKMSAVSSNSKDLSISSSSAPTDNFKDLTVSISQLAAGQANKGSSLHSNDLYTGGLGKQRFEIETDGKTTSFEVEVKSGDTNKAVQQKIADAINSANIGITASINQDSTNGTSALSIRSKQTGDSDAARFSISDVSGYLVSNTGAANVDQIAQDAIYTVDDVEKRSSANSVDLGNGVKATLKQVTSEPVKISVGIDTDYGVNKLKDIVKSYNSLLSSAQTSTHGNTRLQNDLVNAAKSYMSTLEKFGVSMNKDGSLSVNSDKMEAASKDDSLLKYFTSYGDSSYGFAGRLSSIANNVQRNPAYYVTKQQSNLSSVNYINPTESDLEFLAGTRNFNLAKYNSYQDTYAMIGMMFSVYV